MSLKLVTASQEQMPCTQSIQQQLNLLRCLLIIDSYMCYNTVTVTVVTVMHNNYTVMHNNYTVILVA